MLHVRKDEVLDGAVTMAMLKPAAVDNGEVVVPSPDACIEIKS